MALIEQKTAVSAISDLLIHQLKGERLPTWNEVYHAIYDLTPVDAVPVEWLKEKLTGHPELSYAVTDAIQNVLDVWEVEHGRPD